jgi:hypothetical protein
VGGSDDQGRGGKPPGPPGGSDASEADMLAALERAVDSALAQRPEDALVDGAPAAAGTVRPAAPVARPSAAAKAAASAARVASPAEDRFAPPDTGDGLELALEVDATAIAEVRAAQSPAALRRSSIPPPSMGRATSRAPSRRSSGGVGRLLGGLVVLALLAGGGVAGYRYSTLGYVLEPPPPRAVALVIDVRPADAALTLDGVRFTSGAPVSIDRAHVLTARAPGRLGVTTTLPVGGEVVRLKLRLPRALARLPRGAVASGAVAAEPTAELTSLGAALAAVDQTVAKLEQYERCAARLAPPLEASAEAYAASTAQGLRGEPPPVIEAVAGDIVEECRAAIETAGGAEPSLPDLERAAATLAGAAAALDGTARELTRYYGNGGYRVDDLKLGRDKHPVLRAAYTAALAALAALEREIARATTRYERRELEALRAGEGDSRHVTLRAAVLAARDRAMAADAAELKAADAALAAAIGAARRAAGKDTASAGLLAQLAAAPKDDLAAWHDAAVAKLAQLVVELPRPRR